ncbi:MAG: hypothetical protein IPM54_24700 [Polyangiaceae bacterium]|nr:hypothetical protein [Polyangiaceae bacterium]
MTNDRRKRRSEMVSEAASLYLEAVIERGRVKAMALATEEGLLVSGAGKGYDHEWLAALGAFENEERIAPMIDEFTQGQGLMAFDVPIHGRTLRLAAVGDEPPPVEAAGVALSRIFAPMFAEREPVVVKS